MDELGSASSPQLPVTVDGADEDAALAKSRFLTRKEVIQRRLRRVRQLRRCYRTHYWTLLEELRSKYRDYSWTYGKSPFKEDHNESENGNPNGVVNGVGGGEDVVRCRFSGCKTKAMAMTKYCHAHILSDSKQKLYQGCRAVAKNIETEYVFDLASIMLNANPMREEDWVLGALGSVNLLKQTHTEIKLLNARSVWDTGLHTYNCLPTGPSFCNKPVLKSVVPAACPSHHQFGERCLARALRRAGLGNAIPNNRKPTVKLHVVVSEFVHQIQKQRKLALKETALKVETE
ncbi:hypothetical protein ACSQ67_008630 [Phaseolus vulgaris]